MLNKDKKYLDLLCALTNPDAAETHDDKIAALSDDGLYMCVHRAYWSKLSEKSRLRVLQEFENRQARLDGRKPVTIIVEKMSDGCNGYHGMLPSGEEVIGLNINLIRCKRGAPTTAADALATVLHEGRHAFQHNCWQKKDGVPEQVLLAWGANVNVYMPPEVDHLLYATQSIEMDARRFARRRVHEIGNRLAEMGMTDAHFKQTNDKLLAREKRYIALVRQNLTLERIDAIEKKMLDAFRCMHPELKLDKIRLFDHIRLILTHKEINNLQELVELVDRMEDEKMDMLPEKKIDRMPEKLPSLGGRFRG